ncbi:hypothetical protein M0G74_07005 [Microbulbifer sp. CAU 1566]|uniref:hypothetical protein n=1 Tax=Microbulbifer sp. CAU 1566 TaxID=2933269 RepID=UPI002005FF52|nr:hypothetical protein [Microbulbifer sp. CAU 1566]MCK7597021.1 hypothetical protein [Microbulbifer sp. CAU 1566]
MRVLYFAPDGEKIAEKRLAAIAPGSAIQEQRLPQVFQQDFRSGELRETVWESGAWRLRYREAESKALREVVIDDSEIDVIDAGFDAYVRKNWQALTDGSELRFQFASPPHGRSIRLRATSLVCEPPGSALCVRVDLAQPLLRWIAGGDILLRYSTVDTDGVTSDKNTLVPMPRLQRFTGVSNLLDDSGEPQRLQIDYFYR